MDPADLRLLENKGSITAEIVRLSFELGKVVTAIDPAENTSAAQSTPDVPAEESDMQYLIAAKAKLDARVIDEAIERKDALSESVQNVRKPFQEYFRKPVLHFVVGYDQPRCLAAAGISPDRSGR
jgi:hypothetical protein